MANISKQTLETLRGENINFFFYDVNGNDVREYNNSVSEIVLSNSEMGLFKIIKLPLKKEATIEWLMSKVNVEKVFVNFAAKFSKLVNHLYGINVYATTYGIGVSCMYNTSFDEIKNEIESVLNSYGIKYTNEYSEASWVFRYKISKSKENLSLIEKL